MKINGYTRMAAVVAQPIKHSLSPFIHNRAFELSAINGVYLAWEVIPEDLPHILGNVRKLDMFGLNISMPYKQEVIDFMDYLTEEARLIGAVNTVANFDGKLVGHNTDGIGFFKSLKKVNFEVKNQEIVVIGGGGAAMAIIVQAALLGAKKIHVLARNSASFEPLKERLSRLQNETGVKMDLTDLSNQLEVQKAVSSSGLIVNATSVGMDGIAMVLPEEIQLSVQQLVVDTIYKTNETPFLKWAKAQGAPGVNGIGMLLYQAAESFKMWTQTEMPITQIEKELHEKLKLE